MMKLPYSLCWLIGLIVSSYTSQAQIGYQASWKAGMLGLPQNPAAILAAPQNAEFALGSLEIQAANNLFETNQMGAFLPHQLLFDLAQGPDSLLFFSRPNPDFTANGQAPWRASHQYQFQGPGGFWRLETDPDWVERGVLARVFALRIGRQELIQIDDLAQNWALSLSEGLPNNAGPDTQWPDDFWSLRVQEWDFLAGNFGLTLGRGNKLLHLSLGAKLLSIGAFTEAKAYGSQFTFGPGDQTEIEVDSLIWAYNPSFEQALSEDGRRRYNFFENSWGAAVDFGLIFQGIDYNRFPKWEIGLSIQDLGVVQFWNLTQTRYQIKRQAINPDLFAQANDVKAIQALLEGLNADTSQLSEGITENLPMRITAHGKFRLGNKGWGLQLFAQGSNPLENDAWSASARATLCYEKDKFSLFLPVSSPLTLPWQGHSATRPNMGLFLGLGQERLVLGSNDLLSNLFYAATRQGVRQTHLYLGLHFPITKT